MITDLRSLLKVSCHTKFRFAEREAQCILGECGPLTSQSLRAAIGPLQFSLHHWNVRNLTLHLGMLPYKSIEIFFRLHNTFARLHNAAASPASRLRSAGSLAITDRHPNPLFPVCNYITECRRPLLLLWKTMNQTIRDVH